MQDADTRILGAISSVAKTVCVADAGLALARIAAIGAVARVAREFGPKEARAMQERIRPLLLGEADPTHFQGSMFDWLGVAWTETRWTQWLANCLGDKDNVGSIARRAFCEAVCRSLDLRPTRAAHEEQRLAGKENWLDAMSRSWKTYPEHSIDDLGQIDILVRCHTLVAGLEVKLQAGWHDWSETDTDLFRQAERYRDLIHREAGGQVEGLVVLTCRDDFGPEVPRDWVLLHWRSFAQSLRRALKGRGVKMEDVRGLWPLLLGLRSIEGDLLGLDPQVLDKDSAGVGDLLPLRAWLNYLEDDP